MFLKTFFFMMLTYTELSGAQVRALLKRSKENLQYLEEEEEVCARV